MKECVTDGVFIPRATHSLVVAPHCLHPGSLAMPVLIENEWKLVTEVAAIAFGVKEALLVEVLPGV